MIKKIKISYRSRVRFRGNSDSKNISKSISTRAKISPCKIACSCKSVFVHFYLRAILSPRAKVSSCSFVPSCNFARRKTFAKRNSYTVWNILVYFIFLLVLIIIHFIFAITVIPNPYPRSVTFFFLVFY